MLISFCWVVSVVNVGLYFEVHCGGAVLSVIEVGVCFYLAYRIFQFRYAADVLGCCYLVFCDVKVFGIDCGKCFLMYEVESWAIVGCYDCYGLVLYVLLKVAE